LYQSGARTSAFYGRRVFLFFRLAAVQPLLERLAENLAGRVEFVVRAPRLDLDDAHVIAPNAMTTSVRFLLAERWQQILSPSPQKSHSQSLPLSGGEGNLHQILFSDDEPCRIKWQ